MIPLKYNHSAANSHFNDIKGILIKRIKYVLKNGFTHKPNKYIITSRKEKLLFKLLEKEENLRILITSEPGDFKFIIKLFERFEVKVMEKSNNLNRLLYGVFTNVYDQMDNWKFIDRIETDTCPYCNRNYIYKLTKNSKIKPEIDHFYPKSLYPFLGLSFYNLIPSCQTCNGFGAKWALDPLSENMKSPYEINHTDFRFSFKLKKIDFTSPLDGDSKVLVQLNTKVPGNNRVFKLSKLYKKHEDHVLELIIKSKAEYSSKYRSYLNSYKGLSFSDNEINRLIVGNYTDLTELHKRPLSKLYRDIAKQLNMIE